MNKIVLRLSDEQLQHLEALADVAGVPEHEVIIALIQEANPAVRAAYANLVAAIQEGMRGKVNEDVVAVHESKLDTRGSGGNLSKISGPVLEIVKDMHKFGLSYPSIVKELKDQGIEVSVSSVKRAMKRI